MKIRIRYSFVLYIIILHFLDLFKYFFVFFLSIAIHEILHAIVGIIFKLKIESVEISLSGLSINFENLNISTWKKIIVLISGPLINLIIAIGFYIIFKKQYLFIVISNILLFIFNMIPIYPLDGGRILYELLIKYCRFSIATKILLTVYQVFSIILLLLVSYLYVNFYNIQIVFIGIYILGFCRYNNKKNIIVI